jgi:hypothetical protein
MLTGACHGIAVYRPTVAQTSGSATLRRAARRLGSALRRDCEHRRFEGRHPGTGGICQVLNLEQVLDP